MGVGCGGDDEVVGRVGDGSSRGVAERVGDCAGGVGVEDEAVDRVEVGLAREGGSTTRIFY